MDEGSKIAIAAVMRELEEMERAGAAIADDLAMRSNRVVGASIAYSLRLDPGEMAALKRRAASMGMKPSVLARNLIREGLRRGDGDGADYPRAP
jgi:hypothetical protein